VADIGVPVRSDEIAIDVSDRDDRAPFVGTEHLRAAAIPLNQRLVGAGAEHERSLHVAGAVRLDHIVIAVIDEPSASRWRADLP